MAVNKIIVKVDGTQTDAIDFNSAVSGLTSGAHTITVEAYNGATLVHTQTRNITVPAATGGTTYEVETTNFSNTSGVTNTTELNALDATIKYYKNQGLWGTIIKAFYPMLGTTASQRGFNAKDTTKYKLTFYGGWDFTAAGNLSVTSAYAATADTAGTIMGSTTNVGISTVLITDGSTQTTNCGGAELLYLAANVGGNMRWMPGVYNAAYQVPNAGKTSGIYSATNVDGDHRLYWNKTLQFTKAVALSGAWATTEMHYGAIKYNGAVSGQSTNTWGSNVYFVPTAIGQSEIIATGQEMLEEALGRITIA